MKRAFTVVEVLVSMAILSVLMLVVTMLYLFGLRASERSYREMDQLATLQAVAAKLGSELEPAAAKGTSCTVAGDILSLLSGSDGQQILVVDTAGHVTWQKYALYSFNASAKELRRFEYKLPTGPVFTDGPVPLETLTSQPLTDFLVGRSQLMAGYVTSFKAEKVSFRLLHIKLVIQKPNKPEQSVDCSWRIHN